MSRNRSYTETIEYLYGLQKHGIKLALSNTVKLMRLLGDPHRKFPSVHVAGTNGKGSTAAFIASMLRTAGYRVGLYTSPHLVSFTERIRINNALITEEKVVELAQRVRDGWYGAAAMDGSGDLSPTFFEVTTAIAFAYFAEENVDIAVIETGMGGRFDSTNVVMPLVSVITNIDLEHREFLGTTLDQIAFEKAGIIKPCVPVVTGAVQPEAVDVIEREAAAKNAPIYRLSRHFQPANIIPGTIQIFDYQGLANAYPALRIAMLGAYQVDNAGLALAAIECLRRSGISLDEHAVRHGLEQTQWEGRLERVASRPDIYLDGAHNPASAKKLSTAIRAMKPTYRRIILVIGILGDKDYQGVLSELVPLADHVVATKPQYSRAMDVVALSTEIKKLHASVDKAETLEIAIAKARVAALPEDLVLITGSLYVVGDARSLFFPGADRSGALSGLKG
jgi:dihydrofolate synthase/folylpolyglutamate synthase